MMMAGGVTPPPELFIAVDVYAQKRGLEALGLLIVPARLPRQQLVAQEDMEQQDHRQHEQNADDDDNDEAAARHVFQIAHRIDLPFWNHGYVCIIANLTINAKTFCECL